MNEQPQPRSGGAASSETDFVALTKSPGFWVMMRDAALFGVVLAFAALAFLGLVKGGTKLWFTLPKDPGWLDGSLWWVAVTGGAGVLVGVLRRFFRVPVELTGSVEELKDERVEPSMAPGAVAVSLVSLAGGRASGPRTRWGRWRRAGNLGLGPAEAQRGRAKDEHPQRDGRSLRRPLGIPASGDDARCRASASEGTELHGYAGRESAVLFGAFAVYFPIAGSTFVGIYALPPYKYEDWQLLAAVPLGLAAGGLALITVIAVGAMKKLTAPLAKRTILRATIGGVMFGLVGAALPLTLFTGTDQLTTVIDDGTTLGAGLLIAVVFAKILTSRCARRPASSAVPSSSCCSSAARPGPQLMC